MNREQFYPDDAVKVVGGIYKEEFGACRFLVRSLVANDHPSDPDSAFYFIVGLDDERQLVELGCYGFQLDWFDWRDRRDSLAKQSRRVQQMSLDL